MRYTTEARTFTVFAEVEGAGDFYKESIQIAKLSVDSNIDEYFNQNEDELKNFKKELSDLLMKHFGEGIPFVLDSNAKEEIEGGEDYDY